MAISVSFSDIIRDSFRRTRQLIVPSLPFAGILIIALSILVFSAGALPEGVAGFLIFCTLTFAVVFAHSLFSASMYQAVLTLSSGLLNAAWKLTLAWLLMIVVIAIGATMIVLFFSLIGSSLGAVSGDPGQDITDMAAQMRESGTFWPLFAMFMATLFAVFWFAVRMMVFAAATALRGTVHVFRTWYWTKGQFRLLGPAMVILVILPVVGLSSLAGYLSEMLVGSASSPIAAGSTAAVTMIVLLPSAWLGHGFAASVYDNIAPEAEA